MTIITERGLRKHLEERIFVGDNTSSIMGALFNEESTAKFGILLEDDSGFYLRLCERLSVVSPAVRVLNRVYRIPDGKMVAIPYPNTPLRFYYIELSLNYTSKLVAIPEKSRHLKLL